MHDIRTIRADPHLFAARLLARNYVFDVAAFLEGDEYLRKMRQAVEERRAERHRLAKIIGHAMRTGEPTDALKAEAEKMRDEIAEFEPMLTCMETAMRDFLMDVPNLPHESVPGA